MEGINKMMLKVIDLDFAYSTNPVLKNINFEVEQGEQISVIGASGSGKSTLLQCIYGLHPVEGQIYSEGKKLLGPEYHLVPGESFMKYLSQHFDLMPSISVYDNVGKYLSNAYPVKKERRIEELLDLVELTEFKNVKAKHLSGGQAQRVALARVLANPPSLLLLDEPFSHIDSFKKNKLRRNLFAFFQDQAMTVIMATHDSTDALSFADRTLVLNKGELICQGKPEKLYHSPPDIYTAGLFGEVNEFDSYHLDQQYGHQRVPIYPEEFKINRSGNLTVRTVSNDFRGDHYIIACHLEKDHILVKSRRPYDPGTELTLNLSRATLENRIKVSGSTL